MPIYSITSDKKISDTNKQKLANLFTDAHCSIMIAPEQFIPVLFSDGIPIKDSKRVKVFIFMQMSEREGYKIRLPNYVKQL